MSPYYDDLVLCIYGFHINRTKYSRMNEVQFAEDITSKWYHFKFFKCCLPQISLGPFLNTLSQIYHQHTDENMMVYIAKNAYI